MKNHYLKLGFSLLVACLIPLQITAQSLSIVVPFISGYSGSRPAHFNWQFQSSGGGNAQIGQFACGSYWVAPANGDTGVKVLSLTGKTDDPNWNDMVSCDADPITENHGLLGIKLPYPGDTAGSPYGSYDPSENIIPNLPLTYSPASNSCVSLVAAMQRNEPETSRGGTKFIRGEVADAYCVITILPSVPANNGTDMIRPNVTGTYKEFLTWSDFDLTRIPTYSFIEGYDSQGWENARVRWTHSIEIFGMLTEKSPGAWAKYSEGGRAFRSHIVIDEYGAGAAAAFNNDLLALFSSANTLAEKKASLAAMLAYGLDIYHNRYDYGSNKRKAWSSGAGQSLGTFVPPVLLASLLTDETKANVMKKIAITNHDDDQALRGPQELRQTTRGVTGVLLWGDGTPYVRSGNNMNTDDRIYWGRLVKSSCFDNAINGCVKGGGSKTGSDPYGYIDGPPNLPGTYYMAVSAGPISSLAAAMILMPSIRDVVNTDDPIEYADRIKRHGLWTYPDPLAQPSIQAQQQQCSIYDGPCPGFGITWGADPADVRFAIEDGTGRFVSIHGEPVDFNYNSQHASSNWSQIISLYDGDTFEDNAVPLGTLVSPEIIFEFGALPKAYIRTPNVLADIRYTVNGSTPTTSSPLYTGPFNVSENDVVRAKAFQSGKTSSAVRVKTFNGESPNDTTPPSIPTGLAASNVLSTSVDLDWNTSTDDSGVIAGYNVYTNGSNPQLVSNNLATVTGLASETNYNFSVSALDPFGNESSPSSSVNITTLAPGTSTGAVALMFDFGPTSSSGSETNSPAHESDAINGTQTTWNHVAISGASSGTVSSLVYSDGTNATGISFTYGSSPLGVKTIDFTGSIDNNSALGNIINTGIYANDSVATDGIWNQSGSSNDRSIGIRVDGLSAGNYTVFIAGRNTNTGSHTMDAYAIAAANASSFDYSGQTPASMTNNIESSWIDGNNYAELSVTLASGQSLYLITDGDASSDNRGFLNAIQIVGEASASDTEAPSIPSGLSSSNVTASSLDLSWTSATDNVGVTGYRIFRNGTEIGTTATNSYSDSGLSASTAYSYTVSAFDAASNESAQSSAHNVTTSTPVTDVIIDNTDTGSVTITGSWGSSTSVSGYHGSNYQHDGNTDKGNKSFTFTPTLSTSGSYDVFINYSSASNRADNVPVSINHAGGTAQVTVDETINGGTWYFLGNYSFNAGTSGSVTIGTAGTTAYVIADAVRFTIASADTTAPSVPSGLTSSNITTSSVDLDWNASSDNVGVTGYKAYINGTNPVNVGNTTSVSLTGLTAGTSYTFTVSAVDAAANESAQSSGVNVTTSSGAAELFSDDFNDGNADGWTTSGGSWSVNNNEYLNTGSGWSYNGSSSWDNYTVQADVKLEVSTYVNVAGRFQDTNNFYQLEIHEGSQEIAIWKRVSGSWNKIVSASATINTGTWYELKLEMDGNTLTGYLDGTALVSTTDSTFSSGQISLRSGNDTRFDNVLVTEIGGGSSDTTTPSVPTGLASSNITTSSVDLNWNASSDNIGVTGYRIFRNSTEIATTATNSYSDSGLNAATSYSYTITAYDAASNESAQSSAHNVTTASSGGSGGSASIMLDFGPNSPSGSDLTNSPAHTESTLTSSDDTWNVVGTSGGSSGSVSSLSFADGSSATGVSFTYGSSGSGSKVIDFTGSIASSNGLGGNVNSGVYSGSSVGKDGIWNGGSSNSDLSIGIRIDGLSAGNYIVYIMGCNTNAGIDREMDTYALTASSNTSYNFGSATASTITNSSSSAWIEDDNYAAISLSLTSGDSIYVIVDGAVSGGERGFLNAVQIIKE